MSKKAKLPDPNYQVELTYGEIHLLLQAMDTLIDQNDEVREYKSALSIYQSS